MTRGHLMALAERYRGLAARPRLLSPGGDDLADPIGRPQAVYEECGRADLGHLEPLVENSRPRPTPANG